MRNESKIEIAGKERVLKATFANISTIEDECNTGIIALIRKAADGELRYREIVSVIYNGLNGSVDRLEKAVIQKELEERGVLAFLPSVNTFLSVVLEDGQEKKSSEPEESPVA